VTVDRARAAAFLDVYKGVVPEYGAMVEELTAGPALVLELAQRADGGGGGGGGGGGESVVQALRQAAGPADPELARMVRPNSVRARFGQTAVQNALHCTDLECDAALEVDFFFSTQA
jgi:nucleoside-diphosphate kinase